jgi:hypothetical protein
MEGGMLGQSQDDEAKAAQAQIIEKAKADKEAQGVFLTSLNENISRYRKHARRYSFGSFMCYIIAILASIGATFAGVLEFTPRYILSVLTVAPAAILLFNYVLALPAKSTWHWTKARFYDGLINRSRYENEPISKLSKDQREFDERMEKNYPPYGVLPTTPQSTSSRTQN